MFSCYHRQRQKRKLNGVNLLPEAIKLLFQTCWFIYFGNKDDRVLREQWYIAYRRNFSFFLIWNFSIYRCVILAGMMHTHKNWLTLTTLVMLEKSGKMLIVATCEINRGKYMGSRRYGISL